MKRHVAIPGTACRSLELHDAFSVACAFDGAPPPAGSVNPAGHILPFRRGDETGLPDFNGGIAGNLRATFLSARAARGCIAVPENVTCPVMFRPGHDPRSRTGRIPRVNEEGYMP